MELCENQAVSKKKKKNKNNNNKKETTTKTLGCLREARGRYQKHLMPTFSVNRGGVQ